jgi:hypothetical protein
MGGTTTRSPGHLVPGATAHMLDWFKAAGREDGIFSYYRMLAEERGGRPRG